MTSKRAGRSVATLALALLCSSLVAGCDKDRDNPRKKAPGHKAGLPLPPGATVVLEHAKGERYLLELELRSPLARVVAFYRRQLAKEGWQALSVTQIEGDFWGLTARRGMFSLTGRIKPLPDGRVSVGLAREVRREKPPASNPRPRRKRPRP